MITGKLRAQVDKLCEEFWTGALPNPLTLLAQISFLALAPRPAPARGIVAPRPLPGGAPRATLYESRLGRLTPAGINGQFRPPRHIIRLMVDLVEPKPNEVIGGPACGTAGFLVGVMEYLKEKY